MNLVLLSTRSVLFAVQLQDPNRSRCGVRESVEVVVVSAEGVVVEEHSSRYPLVLRAKRVWWTVHYPVDQLVTIGDWDTESTALRPTSIQSGASKPQLNRTEANAGVAVKQGDVAESLPRYLP